MTIPHFLLLIATLQILLTHSHSTTHPQDVQVLKQLKSTIITTSIPPASCLDSWDFTLDPCDNLFTSKFTCGLRCDVVFDNSSSSSFSRVTELALDSPGYYSASLSSVSFNLPFLQNLDLSNNNFTGPLPDSFSKLTRLQRLAVSHNSLSGSIPDSLGSMSGLQEMYLDNNALTGVVPLTFNGLKSLRRLELQGNGLNGELPDLSELKNLSFLDASENGFSGNFPANLPPALVELAMRSNRLDWDIAANAVVGLGSLQVLDLSHNYLTGSVPGALFAHPVLEQLTLSGNRFGSVQVPGDSGLSSQLISVDLSNNELRGFLPVFMGFMPRLSALSLENNKFSGFIPALYVLRVLNTGAGPGGAQFERLLLGGNYLFGPVPGSFMGLEPGSVRIRLGDNCLFRCPVRMFFCEGGVQKSLPECKAFGPVIP